MGAYSKADLERGPIQGVGIGLRTPHFNFIEAKNPAVNWFEILIDNYLGKGGLPEYQLDYISHHYPVTFHGVGMSLGSMDALNRQ